MQGSKSSFFSKNKKASHGYDDGTNFKGGSFKKKDYHHIARNKASKQDMMPHL